MEIHLADPRLLVLTLMRRKQQDREREGVDMGGVLREIISWAERFVPSEAGSVLLDDPLLKLDAAEGQGRLYFVACFGERASELAGTSIATSEGIAGETYRTGRPYISEDVSDDDKFLAETDRRTSYHTHSVICAPVLIHGSVIGVVELVNRRNLPNYDRNDLKLLEIFAGYTATLVENALAAREFEELSRRDNLTGLYNDRFFFQRLEHEVARVAAEGGDTGLVFFDLDHFKEVNDTHGHLAGSAVLKEVGRIMSDVFAGTEAVLARYGGDEFVIIMPGTGIEEASVYAERLRVAIAGNVFLKRSIRPDEPALRLAGLITSSVGVASQKRNVAPRGDARLMAEALLRATDNAMYMAKELGRNQVFSAVGSTGKQQKGR